MSLSLGLSALLATVPQLEQLHSYSFAAYEKDFGKVYATSGERDLRASVFANNLATIVTHNAKFFDGNSSYSLNVNRFADLTLEEFKARRTGKIANELDFRPATALMTPQDLPDKLDYRDQGVVTPVKDQGDCGSCWAFSATESFESVFALKTKQTVPKLAVQQIVSCAPNPRHCGGKGGCDGSTQELAFNYTKEAGLSLESDYPYHSGDSAHTGKCNHEKIKPFAKNDGFVALPRNDYNSLMNALVTVGPIAISVAAGGAPWMFYHGGVVDKPDDCGFVMDHGVTLVGYGTAKVGLFKKMDYWIVRNSWDDTWGEDGYIRLRRYGDGQEPCGVDKQPEQGSACKGDHKAVKYCGMCGILSDSAYPTGVAKA